MGLSIDERIKKLTAIKDRQAKVAAAKKKIEEGKKELASLRGKK